MSYRIILLFQPGELDFAYIKTFLIAFQDILAFSKQNKEQRNTIIRCYMFNNTDIGQPLDPNLINISFFVQVFHDVVMRAAGPLEVLEREVEKYINRTKWSPLFFHKSYIRTFMPQ